VSFYEKEKMTPTPLIDEIRQATNKNKGCQSTFTAYIRNNCALTPFYLPSKSYTVVWQHHTKTRKNTSLAMFTVMSAKMPNKAPKSDGFAAAWLGR
jgi:hypothetical protein